MATTVETEPASEEASEAPRTDRKPRSQINYPPYIKAYGSIGKLFEEIKKASVPPKFTFDFLANVLELKSSSHRALVPLIKKLGFIDQANVPTEKYRQYRDDALSRRIMAEQMRRAYADLYRANEYAHTLGKDGLVSKLRTLTGASDSDEVIPSVAGTFLELKKLADFDSGGDAPVPTASKQSAREHEDGDSTRHRDRSRQSQLGISYTINLNLPATTDIEVFNAIFKSLREHILDEG